MEKQRFKRKHTEGYYNLYIIYIIIIIYIIYKFIVQKDFSLK